jgi:membrane protein
MARAKLKFRLHRAVIVLFCLALLVALMQGASWFSQNHQRQRNPQLEELARTLAKQVTLNLAPLMRAETPDDKRISIVLRQLTEESRILDAGVYDERGDLIARSGESIDVRDRLALDGKKAGGYFNQQIVEPIQGKNSPLGYLRLTLDTHTLATEAKQVDNTTNILRLMLLLSLAIGVVLTRTLLQENEPAGNSLLSCLPPASRCRKRKRTKRKSNLPAPYGFHVAACAGNVKNALFSGKEICHVHTASAYL